MKRFEQKFNQLNKAQGMVNAISDELTRAIETHLGYGWFITYDRGDGWMLGSPDASNYRISTYYEAAKMPREEAIAYIEARQFN